MNIFPSNAFPQGTEIHSQTKVDAWARFPSWFRSLFLNLGSRTGEKDGERRTGESISFNTCALEPSVCRGLVVVKVIQGETTATTTTFTFFRTFTLSTTDENGNHNLKDWWENARLCWISPWWGIRCNAIKFLCRSRGLIVMCHPVDGELEIFLTNKTKFLINCAT